MDGQCPRMLPFGGFNQVEEISQFDKYFMKRDNEDNDIGCF